MNFLLYLRSGEHTSYRIVPKAHCNVHFFDGNIRNTILIDIITIGVKERNSIRGRYPRPSGKQALKTRKWHGLETIDWADISIRNFDKYFDKSRQEHNIWGRTSPKGFQFLTSSKVLQSLLRLPRQRSLSRLHNLFSSQTWTQFWDS